MNCCEFHRADCQQGRDCPARVAGYHAAMNAPINTTEGGRTVEPGPASHEATFDLLSAVPSWLIGCVVAGLLLAIVWSQA